MRDKRFVAEHRGGPLSKARHIQLIKWAGKCAQHVLPLFGEPLDNRLENVLFIATEWAAGKASVGTARNASIEAIGVANESSNPIAKAVARSIGHAVATAHMADHSVTAALYALKAVKSAGKSVETERNWQNEQLSEDIRELILSSRTKKEQDLKL